MKTQAVRIYGKNDLRLEEFDLPPIRNDEILAKVITDSLCMSSFKAVQEGTNHKRIPKDIAINPTILGHEFAGDIVQVGSKWTEQFKPGDKFSIQPALNYENGPAGILSAPGYSYSYIGGNATYVIIPNEVMESNCLLKYHGEGYYAASLAEPVSCVIGAIHSNYHKKRGTYIHEMDIIQGGNMTILAGGGPMGLAAINYIINRRDRQPGVLVVTDIDQKRLDRASFLYTEQEAAKNGIKLYYVNTGNLDNPADKLKEFTKGKGYHDVFVFAPHASIIELADKILTADGCMNFFAGPEKSDFSAKLNFYNVHYLSTHIVGTSGGNADDIKEALWYFENGMDPAGLITHIGGLDSVIDTTMNLPSIQGGKKLIYTQIKMPLTAISDFGLKGLKKPFFAQLDSICSRNMGLWSCEAEQYLLKYYV
jgi:threonine dehydrogenase-like Zn-dependent dehydrogenase